MVNIFKNTLLIKWVQGGLGVEEGDCFWKGGWFWRGGVRLVGEGGVRLVGEGGGVRLVGEGGGGALRARGCIPFNPFRPLHPPHLHPLSFHLLLGENFIPITPICLYKNFISLF